MQQKMPVGDTKQPFLQPRTWYILSFIIVCIVVALILATPSVIALAYPQKNNTSGLQAVQTKTPDQKNEALSPDNAPLTDGDWKMIWQDEFAGEDQTRPDTGKWTLENSKGGELVYYTDQNAWLDGSGNLAMTARKENPGAYQCTNAACQYTSARVITYDKFAFTHGRVEARIKLPYGQGLWPSFMLRGNDIYTTGWPGSGGIGIFENIGAEPATVHGSIHGPGYSGEEGFGGEYTLPAGENLADDFHIFATEWSTSEISFSVDRHTYLTITREMVEEKGTWVFDHPFYLLFNLAVGGNWPGAPDASTIFPQQMLIDYVRVFQHI
jgi:beta-glucanase (GH16 family)